MTRPRHGRRPSPTGRLDFDCAQTVSQVLEAAGVSELGARSMLGGAEEVPANAQRHGGERVSVHVGRVGERFVCEISDNGPGIDDPSRASFRRGPDTPKTRGSGWPAS